MSVSSQFKLMATYNQWMNNNLIVKANTLTGSQLISEKGAYFGSILGTFNHLLIGDVIWLTRFATHVDNTSMLDTLYPLNAPTKLDATWFSNLSDFKYVRESVDTALLLFIDDIQHEDFDAPLNYVNSKGVSVIKPFGMLILHMFNHQTHHRGQITTLLSQEGIDIGVTDLLGVIPSVC